VARVIRVDDFDRDLGAGMLQPALDEQPPADAGAAPPTPSAQRAVA
jgi:hypothetical protein